MNIIFFSIQKMQKEKVYLINPFYNKLNEQESINDLEELVLLADTAGGMVLAKENILLREINAAYYISTGKLNDIRERMQDKDINLIIINTELKPVQVRNLETFFQVRVIGRTELILDIFAKRAQTNESKIQVELAQLKYLNSRLTGHGITMSQLGGGIGTRGPGEKKLEYDKRHIARRIHALEKKLKEIEKHHQVIRSNRNYKVVSLVGYTNAGKTSLLNTLANENLKTENRLFVTLDTTTRKIFLDEQKYVLMSDTVGFIKNLPHDLVVSFRTTLKEVKDSDLILHVCDMSDKEYEKKIKVVEDVLHEMDVDSKKIILIFNKIDKVSHEKLDLVKTNYTDSLFISGKEKINLEKLKNYILFRIG